MARNKRKWQDLSPKSRIAIVVASVVQFGLTAAALADLRRRDPAELNGSRRMWTAVSFVNFVGPIAYFRFGRKDST